MKGKVVGEQFSSLNSKRLSEMIKSGGEQIHDSQMRFFHDQINMYIYKMKRFFNKISC